MKKTVRRLYRRYVPKRVRDHVERFAKATIAASAGVLQAINLLAPAYGEEAQAVVGTIIAVATWIGVRQVPNSRPRR